MTKTGTDVRRHVALLLPALILFGLVGCSAPPAPVVDAGPSARSDTIDLPSDLRSSDLVGRTEPALAAVPAATLEPTREAWQFAAYPGVRISTPSYEIYTTIRNERILDRLPRFLEAAMRQYTTTFGPLPPPSAAAETYVFRDRRQWTAKTRQMLPEQAGDFQNLGRGGFATGGVAVLYYIDWSGRDRDTFAIAAHEGWHQYTQRVFRHPLPIWLEEGIAAYMEGYRFRFDEDEPTFQPWRNRERQSALREAVRNDRLVPLRELLDQSPQEFLRGGKQDLLAYYAQVWALTRFLVEGEEGKYRDDLARALRDAADGQLLSTLIRSPAVLARGGRGRILGSRSGPWLILGYFSNDLPAFEQEYRAFVTKLAGRPARRR